MLLGLIDKLLAFGRTAAIALGGAAAAAADEEAGESAAVVGDVSGGGAEEEGHQRTGSTEVSPALSHGVRPLLPPAPSNPSAGAKRPSAAAGRSAVDFVAIVDDVVEACGALARRAEVELAVSVSPALCGGSLPRASAMPDDAVETLRLRLPQLLGDSEGLRQILMQLTEVRWLLGFFVVKVCTPAASPGWLNEGAFFYPAARPCSRPAGTFASPFAPERLQVQPPGWLG